MLSTRGKIAAHATEDLSPLERAEAARNCLLELGHADVVCALVMSEWHARVGHQPQRFGLNGAQAFEEIA